MKLTYLIVLAGVGAVAAGAQTPAKPAGAAASKPKPAASARTANSTTKLPPGIPVVPGVPKVAFSLRYLEIKVGTGPEAEPNKLYKVHYTGWLAADGRKFDSSFDHRPPVIGTDGKPELDADGKPKLGDPQPIQFPQGFGRVIPGWDQGFNGMHIGGKRRLFIPWQLAYGAAGRVGPDPAHPVIPPKADLIFDIELLDVTDMPQMPGRPGMAPGGMRMPPRPGAPGVPSGSAPQSGTPAAPPKAAAPATAPTAPQAPAQPMPATQPK